MAGRACSATSATSTCSRPGSARPSPRTTDRSSRALAPLFADLDGPACTRHRASCAEALQDDRYRNLLAALQHAIDHPSLEARPARPAGRRCRRWPPAAWRRLKKCGARAPTERPRRGVPRGPQARQAGPIHGRDGRARPVAVPPPRAARRFIRGATRIQDVLGEHQDAVVAGQEIAALLERHGRRRRLHQAARRLLDGQAEAARAAREEFFDAWDKLDRKKSRRWLKAAAKARS